MHRGASAVSELASEYESALQELTFNSKPLINNLTIIAGENMHAAEHIVELVEKRLFDAPPEQKLPSIYLLDSIVKNIGGVYHDLFQRNIVSIFRTTYDAVDEPTRASMRRLLATWVALWPRKVQLIHERIPSAALPSSAAPASAAGAAPSAGAASGPGRGIHINPAYLAKLQGGADRRPGGGGPSSSRRSPPPPRHSISPPPSSSASSSHRRDHGARSPPRKRPRSPPRYGPSGGGGGGGSYKSARRSPPDRINEILGHTPGGRDYDRPHRGEPEGRGAYRPRPTDAGGRFGGGGRPDDPRRPGAHPHPAPPHHHAMPPVAPRSDYNPLPGMAGGGGGYGAMPPQVAAPVAMPQPTAPPPSGGHQVILAEAQVLMQQLEQRLQTQLGQPNVDHSEVMRQLGQLRALQQQATQILTQPGQPIPMAAPAQTGLAAPNLVQNLQGLGQGQQARETILSLLQGTLASVIPPATTLSPPSSQPMSLPAAGAFVAAPAPYALQAPATAPAGIPGLAPPAPAMAMPTEDLLKNLMSMGMIGGPATGMPAAAAAPGMPAPAMVGMTQQPPMPAGMMPSQPGMPPMGGMSAGYPPQGGMPGMPMGAAGGMAGRGPYPGMPGAGGFDAAPPATHRRLDLATENVQVNKLYADFELQCGTCGLRFNDKDKMAKHLDWHFAMNKKEKQKTKKAVSRLWFTTADEWATGIDVAEKPAMPFFNEAAMEESAETPVMNVIADESQTHCGICGEKFDQFWENDLEEWMYRGAVKVEGTGQLFHQKCYEQAAAMTQQAQAQQQQQEQEAAATTSASTNADSSTTTNNGASSSHQFWVKKEPEGEEGASRQNNANDTTPTPSFSSAEGSRASA